MPSGDGQRYRGVSGWIRRWWRALVAEVLATALLVWLGVGSLMPVRGQDKVALTHPALAFGFVVIGNAVAFGPTSGAHMNPAVSLAAALHGRMAPLLAAAYCVAQVLGGLLGFTALAGVTPAAVLGEAEGCTVVAPGVAPGAAAALEAALTGLLVLACCGAWAQHDDAAPDHTVPVKLGLVVAGLVYSGGHTTGASLNPARSFAPALYHGMWKDQWVYWVGPLGGAAVAALLHRALCLAPPARAAPRAASHEEVPLDDKP